MADYAVETILRVRDDATRKLLKYSETLRNLEKQLDETSASMRGLQEAAAGLGVAYGAAARGSGAAASGARSAAAGFNVAAAAANRAAAAVARYNFAAYGGGSARSAYALPRSYAGAALPPPALMKRVGPIALAGAAGGGGGSRATAMSGSSGFTSGGGYGPPGGGGGGGGYGGGPWMVGGGGIAWLGRKSLGAAKWAGLGAAGLGVDAVYEAAELQQQLTRIQIGSHASIAQMSAIRQAAFNISNDTAQSVAQSAGIVGVMASSGINSVPQLLSRDPKSGETFAEMVAKFADVQYLKSGGKVSFQDAAIQGIKLAHLNGATAAAQLRPILDEATKVSFMMPDSLDKYVTQSAYYTRMFTRFGVPTEQTGLLGAWLDQSGGGKRGGTWLQSLLVQSMNPLQLTKHLQNGRAAEAAHFGLSDSAGHLNPAIYGYDKTGRPTTDVFKLLKTLNDTIQKDRAGKSSLKDKADVERQDTLRFSSLFSSTGARAAYLADPTGIATLLRMQAQLPLMPGVDKAQAMYMQNFTGQSTRAWGNFQSLAAEIGGQALPGLTKGFFDLGNALHDAQVWLHQHKDLEMSVQREITQDVKGVSVWMTSHHNDWVMLRNDAAWAFTHIHDLGGALGMLSNAALGTYKAIKGVIDHLPGGPHGMFLAPLTGYDVKTKTPIYGGKIPGFNIGNAAAPMVSSVAGWFVDAIHQAIDPSFGAVPVNVNVTVNAPGATKSDAHHIANTSAKSLSDVLKNGRQVLRMSGATSSGGPNLPRHATAGIGTGG